MKADSSSKNSKSTSSRTSGGRTTRSASTPLRTRGDGETRRTGSTSRGAAASPDHQAIALRAYELYLARNCQHGHDLDDWLQAEMELLQPPSRTRRRAASESA